MVLVFFSEGDGTDCSLVGSYARTISGSADPIRAAFDELVMGPTADEAAAGAGSFFSEETTGMIISTELDAGLLVVDVEDRRAAISNAGTSCGSAAFVSALNSTAFQFPEVESVRFEMEGDTFVLTGEGRACSLATLPTDAPCIQTRPEA